jgi:hypothetical protein
LFPAVGWLVEKTTGIHHLLVFLALSNLAGLVSYLIIFRLFKELEGEDAARWGLLLFAAYPFAYYQAAAYAESMTVATTAGTLLLAQRRHYVWAGFVLGIGVMARQLALLGGAGLLFVYLRDRGWRPKRVLLNPGVLGLLVPWLFIAAFCWYLNAKLGDPFAFLHGRHVNWNEWIWFGVRQTLEYIPYKERPEYFFYIVLVTIPAVGAFALLARRRWWNLASMGTFMMVVTLSIGAVALGRYSATCWPAFLPLGVWASKEPRFGGPTVLLMTLFQGLFFFLFSHQYRIF